MPVFVGSYEDVFCAAAVNSATISVVVWEGVPFRARYKTPFFENLRRYARRPIGMFHALPIPHRLRLQTSTRAGNGRLRSWRPA